MMLHTVKVLNFHKGVPALCNLHKFQNLFQTKREHSQQKKSYSGYVILNSHKNNSQNQYMKHDRFFTQSLKRCQELPLQVEKREVLPEMTRHASEIFRHAIKAVHPKQMIEKVLDLDCETSTLTVDGKKYPLNRNVFIVGMGKAVLGMARVVEDVLGEHVVTGVISIPKGLQQELINTNNTDMMLLPNTKIQVYEGAETNEVDSASYNAAKAIHSLVSKLTERDVLIVLCSGGGSVLCPSPQAPITLEDLHKLNRVLARKGATVEDLNTLRKNVEVLKGGGLAQLAEPAKVISLLLSSIIGDPIDLIGSGPTCPTQPTPHHCLEILKRREALDLIPESILRFLEKEAKHQKLFHEQNFKNPIAAKEELHAVWHHIQNVVVGNNSIACEAAADKAAEMGYVSHVLTNMLTGESRNIGTLFAKLSKFVMMCYDRKASMGENPELSVLEVQLVAQGIRKKWLNDITSLVDSAHNLNKNVCIIAGGEMVVQVTGSGVGGKNQEAALAAAIELKKLLREEPCASESGMAFLSADSDGHDGVTKVAGAVVDLEFLDHVEQSGLNMEEYLNNNDTFNFFSKTASGAHLINTCLTGTNVMDLVILLVQKPQEKKYNYAAQ